MEWATEIEHFFPDVKLTIIDFLPRCLGPLPDSAANYCSEYMNACGIKEFYSCGYDPKNQDFWKKIELPNGADETYVCIGVKASNYFMPKNTLSDKGPGGGGWIHFNKHLQVTVKPSEGGGVWADGSIFAVGDCNYGCIGEPGKWEMPPVPKISYPGEEQAYHACLNVMRLVAWKGLIEVCAGLWVFASLGALAKVSLLQDLSSGQQQQESREDLVALGCRHVRYELCAAVEGQGGWGGLVLLSPPHLRSLGPHDACFVAGANENKGSVPWFHSQANTISFLDLRAGSGYMVNWWIPAALQKEIIETTKIDECRDRWIGILIWHFVHHTPVHLFGRGPWML